MRETTMWIDEEIEEELLKVEAVAAAEGLTALQSITVAKDAAVIITTSKGEEFRILGRTATKNEKHRDEELWREMVERGNTELPFEDWFWVHDQEPFPYDDFQVRHTRTQRGEIIYYRWSWPPNWVNPEVE